MGQELGLEELCDKLAVYSLGDVQQWGQVI